MNKKVGNATYSNAQHFRCNDLRRLKLTFGQWFSVRFHWWVAGDPEEYQHAHPWNFLTLVLWGGYDDVGEGRPTDYVRGPCVRYRPLTWRHAVINVKPRTFTIVITGRVICSWSFWIGSREVQEPEWNERDCEHHWTTDDMGRSDGLGK